MPYAYQVLFCIISGITMFLIDTTVVNVALAKLESVFAVDVATVQWTITAYALASGMTTPMTDSFVARWGMKQVWLAGLSGFTAASMLGGLSPVYSVLVLARILQGVCGGLMLPLGMSTIFRVFPPHQRGMAMGYMAIPIVAGPTLGPSLGGFIVTYLDWRLIFFINLPVGILSVFVGAALLRDEREDRRPILDLWGALLASAGFGTILFGLSRAVDDGWGSLTVEGFVVFGAICLIALVAHELEVEHPLLEFRLFAIPQFVIGNVVGWTSTIALFGGQFLLPLYLQNLRGLSAFDTGVLLLPQGLSTAIMGPIAGKLTDKLGVRLVAVVGFLLLAVNTWNLMHITLDTDYNTLRLLVMIRGLAVGCTMQSSNLVSLASVPRRFLTNASSLSTAMRNVFQSFGIGLLGVILQTQTIAHTALLSQQVTATSEGGLFIQRAAAGFLQATPGLSIAAAQTEARMMLLHQITREGSVLAFGDAYRLTFFAALLAIGLSLFLPMRRPGTQVPAPVAVEAEEALVAAH